MSLVINHNMMAMNAARNLSATYNALATSTQRLSSGLRVNSAADDAAGLAVREMMRADIAVINQGVRNAGDAISMIQTAEGALSVIDEKLTRMKELAEQAATGTYSTAQREIMNSEYQAMASEIDRIASATDFNGVTLLDGSLSSATGLKIHFGTGNSSAEDYYYISVANMKATDSDGLGVGGAQNLGDVWEFGTTVASAGVYIGSNDKIFTFRMNVDSAASTVEIDEFFGFYETTSADTVTTLRNKVNQGPAARITMSMGGITSGTSIHLGDETYFFSTGVTEVLSNDGVFYLNATGDAANDTSVFASAINGRDGGQAGDFWAVTSAAYIAVYARDPGIAGNNNQAYETDTQNIGFGSAGTFTTASDSNYLHFAHGDESWATASIKTESGGVKLVLTGALEGAQYDIDFTHAQSIGAGTDDATYLTGSGKSSLTNYDYSATSEWTQTQTATTGNAGGTIDTQSNAQQALSAIDSAIETKDKARAALGALSNRLENTITNLQIQGENLQAAESRISDVDVATEMTEFTKNNILVQAAVAMLAQANSLPQLALTLIGG